jgi:ATP-binding cassette, subfamily B, bacterial
VFALLQRFYEAQSGNVSIAGVPVNQLKLTDLRNLMSVVPQEPVIFSDSFANNIRYGKPDASLAQIKTAAQAAQLATFIDSLPDGYDTDLGERGVRLSGGQKQRLAIARAILRDAPILLLDEATAALDASSEAEVQKALDAAMTGRTVLVIAHRLATIQHCDTILVFEAGQIVQQGTHDTLMAQKGVYQTLASLQALH